MEQAQELDLRTTYLPRPDSGRARLEYACQIDTLFLDLDAPDGPRTTTYFADGVHAVYDPTTMEVVGFRVEHWRRVFLRRHADLRLPWTIYQLMCLLAHWRARTDPCLPQQKRILATVEQYIGSASPA
jgi:hypothetical protein